MKVEEREQFVTYKIKFFTIQRMKVEEEKTVCDLQNKVFHHLVNESRGRENSS